MDLKYLWANKIETETAALLSTQKCTADSDKFCKRHKSQYYVSI